MKKVLSLLILAVCISLSVSAQKQYSPRVQKACAKYISQIESVVDLTPAEKVTLTEAKNEFLVSFFSVSKEYKGKPELSEKRRECNKPFVKTIIEAFGKDRALVIRKAGRVKK